MKSKDVLEERTKPIPLVAIVGPTGVGKTEIGIFVAESVGGEIINFDSVQVYKYLDIGTAKPTPEERRRVPHHLIDFLDLDQHFDAASFVKFADRAIAEIASRGKRPILVGGTGLYLKALIHGLFEVGDVSEIRKILKARLEKEGLKGLYKELERIDPETAARLSERDWVRILRALEIYYVTGKTFSQLAREHAFSKRRYPCLKIGLFIERKVLYQMLDDRVDKMLRAGLLKEVKELLNKGFDPTSKPLRSIGYRHLISYLRGEVDLCEAVRLMKRDTRRYAKRQLTWFRADTEIKWFKPFKKKEILKEVKRFYQSFSSSVM